MRARAALQPKVALALAFALVFAYAIYESWPMPFHARIFPVSAGVFGLLAALAALFGELKARRGETPAGQRDKEDQGDELEISSLGPRELVFPILWTVAFFAGVVAAGLLVAGPAFTLAYLLANRERPIVAAVLAGGLGLFLYLVFDQLLHIPFPPGMFGLL